MGLTYIPNGAYCQRLREQRGWSQDRLGKEASCGVRTVRNIEKSVGVSADSLESVAGALGISHWHDLLAEEEKARLGLTAESDGPDTSTTAAAPDQPPDPPPTDSEPGLATPPEEEGEPVDAVLILIDVVGYTPQARQAGGPATRAFDRYFQEEVTKRAQPHQVHWIKPIGDAALLWCERPADMLQFVLELLQRQPIAAHGGFDPTFRVIAHKAYFTFSRDGAGAVADVHGLDAILLFRLEKSAHRNRVVVTPHLFDGLRSQLGKCSITHHSESLPEHLKGVDEDSPRRIHILRPPVADRSRDLELPAAYRAARAELGQSVQSIPVFGNLYDPIPMRENFLHMTLDRQRTRGRGNYVRWDDPDLRRRLEVDCGDGGRTGAAGRDRSVRVRADDLFATEATALIAGLPGAGKTTILRHFAWRALEDDPHATVVYVEAKYVHAAHTALWPVETGSDERNLFRVLAALFLRRGERPDRFPPKVAAEVEELAGALQAEFTERRAVILIDALDEAPSVELRRQVTQLANRLMAAVPGAGEGGRAPGPAGRCYLSLRAAELDEHDFTAAPVYLVNPLDMEQIRTIAKRILGEGSVGYARFDDAIWRRTDVQKIAGTPLTAMLMVFFFEVQDRFSRRYDTYRLLVLFVLDRAWKRIKDHQFGSARVGLNPFFRAVRRPDYLADNPEVTQQLTALSAISRQLLYHRDAAGSGARETERAVSRIEFWELLESAARDYPDAPLDGWVESWQRENILLPAGTDSWVFFHSTVLEFLAVEWVLKDLHDLDSVDLVPVFDDPGHDHLETLPILCSVDHPVPAQVLARLGRRPDGFLPEALLPYRCLAELEASDSEFLASFDTKPLRRNKERELADRPGIAWAYEYLERWVVEPHGSDEPEKVAHLDKLIASLAGLVPLPRDGVVRRVFQTWRSDGGSLARKQEELLQKMVHADVWSARQSERADPGTVLGSIDTYLQLLRDYRGPAFADRVLALRGRRPVDLSHELILDQPGHPADKNLAYYRANGSADLLGFLGSPNFRQGGTVRAVAFSPDGRLALSAADDGRLTLWDVGTGREVRGFQGHGRTVHACAFSPDGRQVLSGSFDATLKLWDVGTGREVRGFQGHGRTVHACAFNPADPRIAVAALGSGVLILIQVASDSSPRPVQRLTPSS
ncbi:MAG TPA: helix-turn-helix domain-containing protein [Urbifossiella sp.]|nr:helix-turn-helix domain-containing protein [Urbifossiella sp.]